MHNKVLIFCLKWSERLKKLIRKRQSNWPGFRINSGMYANKHIYHFGHLTVVYPFDGTNRYDVFIDNDYTGNVSKLKGYWIGDLNYGNDLTIEELQQLGKIIETRIPHVG